MSVVVRKRKLKSGKQSIYLDIYYNGRRSYEFLKLYLGKNKEQNKEIIKLAESIRAKRELEIQSSQYGFVPYFKKKINFVQYFEDIIKEKEKGKADWQNVLNYLKSFTNGNIQFSAITPGWLEQFKNYLLINLSRGTSQNYFTKVSAALNQAIKDEIISTNPCKKVSAIKVPETQKTFLTIEEIRALANTPCERPDLKRAFLFACYTGLRVSDIEALTWGQIKNDRIEFRQKKTMGFQYMPISPTAKKILYDSDSENSRVLHMPDKKIFSLPTISNINLGLRKWAKKAGIDRHVSFHVSRHSFATLALSAGADLYVISKLLGHKKIETTQIYAQIIDSKKKEAVDLLPEIEVK